ncbi:protein-L-isoaspartate(D-aspartate) O-methyltransferase [Myxococcota bacterium]|nr:protein-L-isoaspartate(D-aspartate) O-methyltransferase [Myxococcota bacterium]
MKIPRRRMVERLAASGLRDKRVLAALNEVPRHELIPSALRGAAYREAALPIGEGQTISAPRVVAAMTAALQLRGNEEVLEIGTGSGYQAAVLSRLAARVVTVERHPKLVEHAREALMRLGITNVEVHLGDGSQGRGSDGPFDAIIVTAGGPSVPEPLLEQLSLGGALVGPFGPRSKQWLMRFRRRSRRAFAREKLGRCRFVDLVGSHGWAA